MSEAREQAAYITATELRDQLLSMWERYMKLAIHAESRELQRVFFEVAFDVEEALKPWTSPARELRKRRLEIEALLTSVETTRVTLTEQKPKTESGT